MTENDQHVTVQHITVTMNISVGSAQVVLTDILEMRKMGAPNVDTRSKIEQTGNFKDTFS